MWERRSQAFPPHYTTAQFCIGMYLFSIVLFTVTSLNYVASPPVSSDPNLDQNYDIFVGTILAFNANVLHAPNRVRSKIRKDPLVTLFFGRTSLSNRNIVLATLLLTGDVHPNPGPINRDTIYPGCGYCQQHVGWSCSGVGCETFNVWYHRECVSITRHSHYSARIRRVRIAVCDAFLPSCESIFKMVRSMRIIL